MKRSILTTALALSCLLPAHAAQPTPARELDFNGFTALTTRDEANDQIVCNEDISCHLRRLNVGPLTIDESYVYFNKSSQRISLIVFMSNPVFIESGVAAFTAKYGKPSSDVATNKINKTGGPYKHRMVQWRNFTQGASVTMERREDAIWTKITWAANAEAPKPPKVDF